MTEPDAKTVLVVDDEPHIRDLLRKVNESLGYRTVEAKDGFAALVHVEKDVPDLVITDIYMPAMNGIQLLRKIRRINPVIPVILITGCTHQKPLIQDHENMPDAYVEKPFRLTEIADKIRALIG